MGDAPFVPPPAASPQPPGPRDDARDTGEFPVVRADMRKAFRINELFTAAVALLMGLGTLWIGQYVFVGQARAAGKEAADSGIAETRLQAAATQRELERFERESSTRADRVEQGQARTDAKLDALLNALRVPNPAPAPRDGGQ